MHSGQLSNLLNYLGFKKISPLRSSKWENRLKPDLYFKSIKGYCGDLTGAAAVLYY